jgi:hypothetical protein
VLEAGDLAFWTLLLPGRSHAPQALWLSGSVCKSAPRVAQLQPGPKVPVSMAELMSLTDRVGSSSGLRATVGPPCS